MLILTQLDSLFIHAYKQLTNEILRRTSSDATQRCTNVWCKHTIAFNILYIGLVGLLPMYISRCKNNLKVQQSLIIYRVIVE